MSIFRKASELNNLPDSVNNALFDQHDFSISDDFEGLLKEAGANKMVYENRVKGFKQAEKAGHDFEKVGPAKYAEAEGGIRRSAYGKRFSDENSELFGSEKIRSIGHDNNKYAESLLSNGFSIWEPEFDELEAEFKKSQDIANAAFDRRTAAEKKASAHKAWEYSQASQIRKANVLPYRGLGVSRLSNEQPIHHGDISSVNDFYAEAHDEIKNMSREANSERKAGIKRKGVDPADRINEWQNKEAIAARTMRGIENSEFLTRFAEGINLDE